MKPPRRIQTGHYTTAGFPPGDSHELWAARGWPSIAALFDSTPIGPFHTSAETVILDGVPVSYAIGSARRFERTPARIAEDRIDVLGISVLLEGGMRGDAAGSVFAAEAGEVVMLDMGRVSTVVLTESRSIQLAVPRARAEQEIGQVAQLHGRVIERGAAILLYSHLLQLAEGLKHIPESDAPRVARTLIDMLALAVRATGGETPAEGEAIAEPATQRLALRARGEIERNLGSTGLSVASLCRRLDISRSTLHRLFEAEGGVQAHIRKLRLEAARTALTAPDNAERIGDIAERLGFSDAAHLSRLFRQQFGESPRDYRARARGDDAPE